MRIVSSVILIYLLSSSSLVQGYCFFGTECDNGNSCYTFMQKCDGRKQCEDGADENNCGMITEITTEVINRATNKCYMWQYVCDNGDCYSFDQKCDGHMDCSDGSDELNCTTTSTPQSTAKLTRETTVATSDERKSYTVVVPGTQIVQGHNKINDNVDVQCTAKLGWKKVAWYKPGEMLENKKFVNGRLILQRIKCEDAGSYVCYPDHPAQERSQYAIFTLHIDDCLVSNATPLYGVEDFPSPTKVSFVSPQTFTTPAPCKNVSVDGCCCVCSKQNCMTTPAPPVNGFQCSDGSWIYENAVCNGERDCQDGSDEMNCELCSASHFTCRDGGCIPSSKYCDGRADCRDSSDESQCSGGFAPKIIELPQRHVEIDCFDPNKRTHGPHILELECKFLGNPIPVIKWKKYEGEVHSKCQQSTFEGHGLLKCPDFQQSDQGAYSCVAQNSEGVSESQPKSVVKCSHIACDNGFTVIDEHNIESCLECFCSGTGSKCNGIRSKGSTYTYDFPTKKIDVPVNRMGEVFFDLPLSSVNLNDNLKPVEYCYLSKDDLLSAPFINSYGKNLNIPVLQINQNYIIPEAPDIIIKGNDMVLKYSSKIPQKPSIRAIRFWQGYWNLNDNRIASRSDIMKVLVDVDAIYIRCKYDNMTDVTVNSTTKIVLESSEVSSISDSVSYLEKCECPTGYDGLSCQKCASGFEKVQHANGVKCEKKSLVTCPEGYIGPDCKECDVHKFYYMNSNKTCVKSQCTMAGSIGRFPDRSENCICKERVEGKNCDTCKSGSFYLDETNKEGCLDCWCNGLGTTCRSSGYYKSSISSQPGGGYNSSNGLNFWLLPKEFNGNRLTSYGGFLEYSFTYLPNTAKQPKRLSVEILTDKGTSINYFHESLDLSLQGTTKTWKVPMEEKFWKDRSDQYITRGKFLSTLSRIKAIYVESPYELSSGVISISWVKLDTAEDMDNNIGGVFSASETMDKIEKCSCPPGYMGLSCESCADGYYKQKTGEDTFICIECVCDFCDPERGCMDCAKGEYRNNSKSGGPPICLKCPCNNNEELCMKGEYDVVVCFCKIGYSGIHCENELSQHTHLGIKITPTDVINKKSGDLVIFTCSYNSTEDMTIEFERKYKNQQKDSILKLSHIPGLFRVLSQGKISSAEIAIEEDLLSVDCVLRDSDSTERARASTLIKGTVSSLVIPQISNCYDEPKFVHVNEDLDLICEATGSPQPETKWYVVENGNYKSVDTVDGVHVVTRAQLDQNGTIYMCIARNSIGDDKCTTHVIVKERCRMTISPPYARVEEGEDVRFDCVTANWEPVSWRKSDGFLPYGVKVSGGELTIKNVSLSQAGDYECSVIGRSEPIKKIATLEVLLKKIHPTALIVQEDTTLRPGDSFRMVCIVSGQPKPNVTWTKVGDSSLPWNIEVNERDHSITISNANTINNGIYECRAESAIGSSTSRIQLKISASPRITIDAPNKIPHVGDIVVLKCLVLEGEFIKLTWYKIKDDSKTKVANGSELRFQRVSSDDAGKYECEASNSFGQAVQVVEMEVVQVPSVQIFPEGPLRAFLGEIHDFYCNASGIPIPKISWTSSGGQNTKPLPGIGNRARVIVTEDMEKVICQAENSAGTGRKSVDIIIKHEKGGSTARHKRVPIGSRVEMIFDDLNGPLNCTRLHSSLVGDECYIKKGLEIPSVQVQHNGTYVCRTGSGQEMSYSIEVVGFVNKFSRMQGSYIRLPMKFKSTKKLTVEITFKIQGTRGLILLKRKHHDFTMYLQNGRVVVKLNQIDFNRGRRKFSNVVHLKSMKSLKVNVWYTVIFRFQNSVELLIHDEHGTIVDSQHSSTMPNVTWTTNFEDDLYVGGATGEKRLPLPLRDVYFDGCISRLIVDEHEYHITEEGKYSRNVSLCNVCSDNIDPCGDEGVCLDAPTQYGYICVCGENTNYCPESCMGTACQTSHDMCRLLQPCHQLESTCISKNSVLRCHCPPGFSGHTCDTELLYEFSFEGDGYAKLPHSYLPRYSLSQPEVIHIAFTQDSNTGLLFFQGDRNNFLLIAVDNGELIYVYYNQGKLLEETADIKTEFSNHVIIRRMNNTVEISVGKSLYGGNKSEFRTNRVHGDIFIGGIPSNKADFPYEYEKYHKGFKGCIHSLIFGTENNQINIMEKDITRHNLGKACKHRDISSSSYDEDFSNSSNSS